MAAIARPPSREADVTPFLLRLYPVVWRARYGEEFAELLAARPPGLRDRLDILRGAVDARIHPQLDPNATGESHLGHDRSIGAMLVAAGILLTMWAGFGVLQMPRWESGDPVASPELLSVSYTSGMLGAFVLLVALVVLAFRYDWSIGSAGAVAALITGVGIFLAALGGGVLALVMLAGGAVVLAWRMRGRLLGTVTAIALALGSTVVAAAFIVFAAGGGQDTRILSAVLAFGPMWILVGLDLRAPDRQVEGLVNA
jgi:hypothetical protein